MRIALMLSVVSMAIAAFDSNDELPTVSVKNNQGGELIINKSDYDANPDAYELWDGPTAEAPAAPAPVVDPAAAPAPVVDPAAAPAAPVQMLVSKTGTGQKARWFVTDKDGTNIAGMNGEGDGGYGDEPSAWAAISAASLAAQQA